MDPDISFRLIQFRDFFRLLMSNAPQGYIPHLIKIQKNAKVPIPGVPWKKKEARITYDEALTWIEAGGNVALAAMADDPLQPVDADNEAVKEQLKPGLQTIGRSRIGGHGWYWSDPNDKKLPANITTAKGEARGLGQFILIPGSYIETTQAEIEKKRDDGEITAGECFWTLSDNLLGFYTIDTYKSPTSITFSDLPQIFRDKVVADEKQRERIKKLTPTTAPYKPQSITNIKRSRLFDLTIEEIVGHYAKNQRFPHPLHPSETGQNFSVGKGVAHCWRHLISLNPLQFLAVKSGYARCEDAGTGHKGASSPSSIIGDDGAIFHAWREAKKNGLIPPDDPIPTRALCWIAAENGLCPPQQIPARGSGQLLPKYAYDAALDVVEEEY